MKIYIVDDEDHARENLHRKIESLDFEIEFCGEANSVESAFLDLQSMEVDLLFLDIEMPHEDGFALLDRFDHLPFSVIFVTAYNDFALKAFEYFTLGYVTKPIDIKLLEIAISKVFSYKEQMDVRVRDAIDNIRENEVSKIVIPSTKGFALIPCETVIFIESGGDGYTTIHCLDGTKQISTKRLKDYEDVLGESGFLRAHRSYLINYHHIVDYKKEGTIILSNDHSVTINKNNRRFISEKIKDYFNEM